jgi:hypothetical protein
MSDVRIDPAASPPPPAATPRLSILHLLMWTGFTAACIAFAYMNPAYEIIPQPVSSIIKVLALPLAMLDGAAIAAFVVLLPIAFVNQRRLLPGHWILLSWGVTAVVGNLSEFGLGAAIGLKDGINSAGHLDQALGALKVGMALPFVLTPMLRLPGQRTWTVYFAMRTGASAIAMIVAMLSLLTYLLDAEFEFLSFDVITISLGIVRLCEFAAFITLIVGGILDHRAGRRGDWLHCTGLAMVLLFPLATGAPLLINFF